AGFTGFALGYGLRDFISRRRHQVARARRALGVDSAASVLAGFNPLWPDLNFTVAGFDMSGSELNGARARLIAGRSSIHRLPPIPEAIPSTDHLSQTKPRPSGAFFFWPPQLAASFC